MPIRPENVDRYPPDWPAISLRIRQRDGNCCKRCGVKNHALGGRTASGKFLTAQPLGNCGRSPSGLEWPEPGTESWCGHGSEAQRLRIIRVVLTVAHLDHTPENCADANLESMCQRCHNIYDGPIRRAGIAERARVGNAVGDLFA